MQTILDNIWTKTKNASPPKKEFPHSEDSPVKPGNLRPKTFQEIIAKKKKSQSRAQTAKPTVSKVRQQTTAKKVLKPEELETKMKKYEKPPAQEKPLTSRESKLLDNVINFKSYDEMLDMLSNKGSEFSKMFPVNKRDQATPMTQFERENYKPQSKEEAEKLRKIEQINRIQESQEIKLLGKKQQPKTLKIAQAIKDKKPPQIGNISKQKEKEIFSYQFKNQPTVKKPEASQVEPNRQPALQKKIEAIKTNLPSKPKIEVNKYQKLNNQKLQERKPSNLNYTDKMKNFKQEKQKRTEKQPIKKTFYSARDFLGDEDDFLVEDDDPYSYKKYLLGINQRLSRGRNRYDDYQDESDDLMEANFDTIQQEEMAAQRIAEKEDELEELRERELLKRRKY